MIFFTLFQICAVAYLSGSTLSARIIGSSRVEKVFEGTDGIKFTCEPTISTRYFTRLEWDHMSQKVNRCSDGVRPSDGSFCYTGGLSIDLCLGTILKGYNDGKYTCKQYWYPNNRKTLRSTTSVSVIVIEVKKPSPSTFTTQGVQASSPSTFTTPGTLDHGQSTSISIVHTTMLTAQTTTAIPDRRILSTDKNNVIIIIISGTIAGVVVAVFVVVVAAVSICLRRRRSYTPADGDVISNVSRSRSRSVQRTASSFPWEFPRDKLKLVKELGEGCFSTAYEAQAYGIISPNAWTTVVVKTVRDDPEVETHSHASLLSEAKLLSDMGRCQHENVLRLLGISSKEGPLWLILEYAQHGDLKRYLRSMKILGDNEQKCSVSNGVNADKDKIQVTEKKAFHFGLQIARGMEYLTSSNILHRDLAARNVLVFDGEILKICDFGMAKDVRYVDYYRRRSPGHLPIKWTAPEAIKDKVHTQASDVWSYGIVLWEIATLGESPYPGIPNEWLYARLKKRPFHMSCPFNCPRRLYDVMLKCWAIKPSERPNFSSLVQQIENVLSTISETPATRDVETDQDQTQCARQVKLH